MAKLLRDWLAPELIDELRGAIEWYHKHLPGSSRRDPGDLESDDESLKYAKTAESLRVEISRPVSANSYVQIVETNPRNHGVISDGRHSIIGVFEDGLSRKLEKETGRRFEQLGGSLMILKTFTLVITKDAPLGRKMTLELESAKYRQGTMNSSVIGHPNAINEHLAIRALYETLQWGPDTMPHLIDHERQSNGRNNLPESLLSQSHSDGMLLSQAPVPDFDDAPTLKQSNTTSIDEAASRAKRLLQMGGLRQKSPPAAQTQNNTPSRHPRPENPNANVTAQPAPPGHSSEKPQARSGASPAKTKDSSPPSPREKATPAIKDTAQPQISDKPDAMLLKYSARGIPKDQRALLDKPESWLPSIPGRQFPITNVPLSVLNLLKDSRAQATIEIESRKPGTPKKSIGEIAASPNVREAKSDAEDLPEASQISWESSPVRPSPGKLHAPIQVASFNRAPLRGQTPPDSSALSPGWAKAQLQRRTSLASIASSEASSDVSELSEEAEDHDMDLDSDQDLAISIPHRLDAKRKPSASHGVQIDVEESPCKKPKLDEAQNSSGAIPATQIGSSQSKMRPNTAEPEQPATKARERTPRRRPGIVGDDEIATQDPAAKYAQYRRANLHGLRQDHKPPIPGPSKSHGSSPMSARSIASQSDSSLSARKSGSTHDQPMMAVKVVTQEAGVSRAAREGAAHSDGHGLSNDSHPQLEESPEPKDAVSLRVDNPNTGGVDMSPVAGIDDKQQPDARDGDELLDLDADEDDEATERGRMLFDTEWPSNLYGRFGQSYCELDAVQSRLQNIPARRHINVLGWRLGTRKK